MDVVDISSGNLRKGVVTFPHAVQHVSVDESSRSFLIFTTEDGSVGWQKLGNADAGALTQDDYVVADW